MRAGRLALRPWPLIVAAYVAAPIVAATGACIAFQIPNLLSGRFSIAVFQVAWMLSVVGGEIAGLIVEFFVVTPLLLAFMWWEWRWLNTLSMAFVGFGAGILLCLPSLVFHLPLIFELNQIFIGFAFWGGCGISAAIVFRFVAFYREKAPTPARVADAASDRSARN